MLLTVSSAMLNTWLPFSSLPHGPRGCQVTIHHDCIPHRREERVGGKCDPFSFRRCSRSPMQSFHCVSLAGLVTWPLRATKEFLPGLSGQSNDGNDTGPVWPRILRGRSRRMFTGILGSVRKKKHISLRGGKKAFVSKKNGCIRGKCHT